MSDAPRTKQELEARIRRERKAVLLGNSRSRSAGSLHREMEEMLTAHGFQLTTSHLVREAKFFGEHVERALSDDPPLLVIASGDGTISRLAGRLANTETVLGCLPLGTTNNFGRRLTIPCDLEGAIEVIASGKVADVDLGKVNGDYFCNMVGMGVSAMIAADTSRTLKRTFGRLAYALYSFGAMLAHKPFKVEITANGSTHVLSTHQFSVASGCMHSGLPIASDASIDNRTLLAYALGGANKWSTLRAVIVRVLTTHRPARSKGMITAQTMRVVLTPPQDIEIDGEVRKSGAERGEFLFEVAPEALKVLVPQSFQDE